jgi:hypothetical protein
MADTMSNNQKAHSDVDHTRWAPTVGIPETSWTNGKAEGNSRGAKLLRRLGSRLRLFPTAPLSPCTPACPRNCLGAD